MSLKPPLPFTSVGFFSSGLAFYTSAALLLASCSFMAATSGSKPNGRGRRTFLGCPVRVLSGGVRVFAV